MCGFIFTINSIRDWEWNISLADERKKRYFPFLEANKVPVYTKDLKYCYKRAYMELPLDLISFKYNGIYRCIFILEEKDKFHFAIYFENE